uniref:vitamin-K-epoxide reductase (warfarin-sensitive) n=1 Tax=Albugo laibachii Nc14 TaxID=890382 RepID=F0W250_9STRA|nr:vitamin K epoxide reductase complex putative [Albugo laibachii Nc14]|eukprot:CCA15132.1 vitamin K epoxide reductase complex putative [Albugo laibachii Nc14]
MYTRQDRPIQLWGALGALVAAYGNYVEYQKHRNAAYQAVCDSSTYSCSRVLSSTSSHLVSHLGLVDSNSLLDISNSALGLMYYTLCIIAPYTGSIRLSHEVYLISSILAEVLSAYLAYILVFQLQEFCMVCVSSYVVNSALLWLFTTRQAHLKKA